MAIVNSTFSGNLAFVGGGLKSQGVNAKANVTNSTIFGNSVPNDGNGGGLFNQQGTLMIINSIIAGNRGEDCYNRGGEWLGDLTGSNNLDSDGTCPGSGTLDGLDSELADNGGPTLTHALLGGSSAIDTGDPASCSTTDQRGAERSGTCDIGAYEFGSSVPDSD